MSEILAHNLKELRGRTSQEAAAYRLNLNRSTYQSYENGRAEPNITRLIEIARFYKITVDKLITEKQ